MVFALARVGAVILKAPIVAILAPVVKAVKNLELLWVLLLESVRTDFCFIDKKLMDIPYFLSVGLIITIIVFSSIIMVITCYIFKS